jgi:hypothetical protein
MSLLSIGVAVLAVACSRGATPPPEPDRPASPPPSAATLSPASPSGVDAGEAAAVASSDAGAAPFRPVVFHAFRRTAQYGKADRVSPRLVAPDGEPDAVFEVVLEGDVAGLVVYNAASSTSARTEPPKAIAAPPAATAVPLPPPRVTKPVIPVTKHAPELFAFEDADAGITTMPSLGGRRRLVLHTWAPPGAVDWGVYAELPDGSFKPGPTTH